MQLVLSIWLAHLAACAHPDRALGSFSMAGGDHPSYLGAMEHYITEGRYYFVNQNGVEVIAGRMPHYAVPYYLLRQFLDVPAACDVITVLQVLLMSVAMWLLARLLAEESGRALWGILFLLAATACAHLTPYLHTLLPDAPGFALLAIAMYFYWRTEQRDRVRDRVLLALALGALVVLKPYFVLLYPLIVIRWWWRRSLVDATKRGLVLGLPLIVLLAPWWIRNARHFDRFFPFQQDLYAGYGYGPEELRVRDLLVLVGADAATWWEPSCMACVFKYEPTVPCTFTWPEEYSPLLLQRFSTLRDAYQHYQITPTPQGGAGVMAAADAVELVYRNEQPWHARFINRLILVRRFMMNSGSYHLPVHSSNPCYASGQVVVKLLASAGYLTSVAGLVFALPLIVLLGRWRKYGVWLVPALYQVALFPLALGAVEWRSFAPAFIFDLWLLFLLMSAGAEFVRTRFLRRGSSRSNMSAQ